MYQCISPIGIEQTLSMTRIVMHCNKCKELDTYAMQSYDSVNNLICKSCGAVEYLMPWDGITCPNCEGRIRAIGSNVDIPKVSRFKW
jgi:hypothetical protein